MKENRTWDEFKEGASEWPSHLSRREFLELAGASLFLAGLTGCTHPPGDPVFPYVNRPEGLVPDQPTYFATARVLGGLATGVLVETHMGRPTKVEGNPDHPASQGAASAWMQASVLGLYDPDRGKEVKFKEQTSSWAEFKKAWQRVEPKLEASKGDGLVFLTDLSTSPSLRAQMADFKNKFPNLKWLQYEPLSRSASLQASQEIFGKDLSPIYDFKKADVVVSFDADFLSSLDFPVSYAKDFMQRRRQFDEGKAINQLFVFDSGVSLTGLKANHRMALKPSELEAVAGEIFAALQGPRSSFEPSSASASARGGAATAGSVHAVSETNFASLLAAKIRELALQIQRKKGRCVFLAGPQQAQSVHSICHDLNFEFGHEVVSYLPSPQITSVPSAHMGLPAIQSLCDDLAAGKVRAIFIVGTNPAYSLPPDLRFSELIVKAEFRARLGLHEDETAALCPWFLPMSDDFEAWSDSLSFDGSTVILQPVIRPLYETKNFPEVLELISNSSRSLNPNSNSSLNPDSKELSSYEIVTRFWKKKFGAQFDDLWSQSLKKGVVPSEASARVQLTKWNKPRSPVPRETQQKAPAFEILCRPSLCVYDGRFANNVWLQELPDPLTQVTWDNIALVNPASFPSHKIKNGQILEVKAQGRSLQVPAWLAPELPEKTLVLFLGYGRQRVGKVGNQVGSNVMELFTAQHPDSGVAEVIVKDKFATLACAQVHQKMEGLDPIKNTDQLPVQKKEQENSLYPKAPRASNTEEAWGMVIDLDSCTGCSACVVACQSENNIPSVGKKGVLLGREMHWIRVDRYQNAGFQPVPCMHCEKAPCEPVCPVGATVHGNGGLNQMVYNRCVGTRYCSNNCPYKVRKFNFLHFAKFSDLEKLQKNPDVSIRPRGVMEKCTYCVQRINRQRIQAQLEDRKIRDGEVQTACQQTCPTQAISFGNLADPHSQVRAQKNNRRNYSLLEELGTRPRTTYLAVLTQKELQSHD